MKQGPIGCMITGGTFVVLMIILVLVVWALVDPVGYSHFQGNVSGGLQ